MINRTVGFIGGGNMTRAIAGGLISAGFDPQQVLIGEPSAKQRESLAFELPGAQISADNLFVATQASCLVLAIKPQILADVCKGLRDAVQQSRPLVISIAAGVRSDDIDTWLGGDLAVLRVMPNQPALLRKGVSGIYANDRVSDSDRAEAESIMSAVGSVVHVPREADIDAVTAISGSGPAYFYLLIDMLFEAGENLGLDAVTAAHLAIDTAVGSAALASHSVEPMGMLMSKVRSPGGTTAAALDTLDANDVRAIFDKAFRAARDRAIELADQAHIAGRD
jgi:pyrroline-5-carboxylate reductase